jgi:hypothetical protein
MTMNAPKRTRKLSKTKRLGTIIVILSKTKKTRCNPIKRLGKPPFLQFAYVSMLLMLLYNYIIVIYDKILTTKFKLNKILAL